MTISSNIAFQGVKVQLIPKNTDQKPAEFDFDTASKVELKQTKDFVELSAYTDKTPSNAAIPTFVDAESLPGKANQFLCSLQTPLNQLAKIVFQKVDNDSLAKINLDTKKEDMPKVEIDLVTDGGQVKLQGDTEVQDIMKLQGGRLDLQDNASVGVREVNASSIEQKDQTFVSVAKAVNSNFFNGVKNPDDKKEDVSLSIFDMRRSTIVQTGNSKSDVTWMDDGFNPLLSLIREPSRVVLKQDSSADVTNMKPNTVMQSNNNATFNVTNLNRNAVVEVRSEKAAESTVSVAQKGSEIVGKNADQVKVEQDNRK